MTQIFVEVTARGAMPTKGIVDAGERMWIDPAAFSKNWMRKIEAAPEAQIEAATEKLEKALAATEAVKRKP